MHEKYTTRGLIVYASAYREADKILSVYTEDFGLVSAVAAGVRRSTSKLRYHTQDLSVRDFTLVRGRDLWRLVGAEEIDGVAALDPTTSNGEALAVYARVISLIRRLVRGEEKNEQVFLDLFSLYKMLPGISLIDDTSKNLQALEVLVVFRILHSLGYIRADALTKGLIEPALVTSDLVLAARPLLPKLVFAINAGLVESHL
ncbi:MAG: DNA repair protein RecO [Candidatus Pacebacteria bacterium]|nr:DNA repair protein RecO [Candidatus Paceibacterota bacterium]